MYYSVTPWFVDHCEFVEFFLHIGQLQTDECLYWKRNVNCVIVHVILVNACSSQFC